jgi:hypothetical protein
MQKVFGSARGGLLVLCSTCLAAGCTDGPKLPPLVPVAGKVTVGGETAKGGQVALVPTQKGTLPDGAMALGTIDSSGNYSIMTNGQAGAPAGQYKVVVTPPMMPSPDGKSMEQLKIYQNYSANKTDLNITVQANGGSYNLDLKERAE